MSLTIALPKGRLFEESIRLLKEKGILSKDIQEGRKLLVESDGFSFLLVKPSDVPVYVENGVADLGIAGYDVLLEREPNLYVLLDLGIGLCRIVVAGREESKERYFKETYIKVATKYPNIAKKFFSERGVKSKIIYLSGSVELAPAIGLSDYILDIVQTGRTLRENKLVVIEEVATSTARLVCNKASYRNKRDRITGFFSKLM
ncbi:ATP phosphoribosyltransferase [Hydrogenobacter thermophilus TK-6]|uniref:ATP phosphoribosyltransferase n=1 Tax=Hydrogenobacter thermophilus (strain DSM 6534 / IAM 12695 / TK-6) TaxID=608538 RepID=D3DKB1_HYDTT|nr:ATP phosphoribosyltransferase [Hydrogenobacter thermophilus]ADO46183.1 ATP phosphoribosyltransferase [Hydrogenobacter thermophilus TK-6]BAI70263.1 ATP phosphoribosyltransferase [Hydrogenobacter thermophilus TK-6]